MGLGMGLGWESLFGGKTGTLAPIGTHVAAAGTFGKLYPQFYTILTFYCPWQSSLKRGGHPHGFGYIGLVAATHGC